MREERSNGEQTFKLKFSYQVCTKSEICADQITFLSEHLTANVRENSCKSLENFLPLQMEIYTSA